MNVSWGDVCITGFSSLDSFFSSHYDSCHRCSITGLNISLGITVDEHLSCLDKNWFNSRAEPRVVACQCLLTWCCTGQSHPWRSAAACCQWWHHGSWLPSRWQRKGQASIWSPAWTGPSPGRSLGICCTPAEGHSTSGGGRCSLCNPVEMTSSFAYFEEQQSGLRGKEKLVARIRFMVKNPHAQKYCINQAVESAYMWHIYLTFSSKCY